MQTLLLLLAWILIALRVSMRTLRLLPALPPMEISLLLLVLALMQQALMLMQVLMQARMPAHMLSACVLVPRAPACAVRASPLAKRSRALPAPVTAVPRASLRARRGSPCSPAPSRGSAALRQQQRQRRRQRRVQVQQRRRRIRWTMKLLPVLTAMRTRAAVRAPRSRLCLRAPHLCLLAAPRLRWCGERPPQAEEWATDETALHAPVLLAPRAQSLPPQAPRSTHRQMLPSSHRQAQLLSPALHGLRSPASPAAVPSPSLAPSAVRAPAEPAWRRLQAAPQASRARHRRAALGRPPSALRVLLKADLPQRPLLMAFLASPSPADRWRLPPALT
jgi:hypothetical protein